MPDISSYLHQPIKIFQVARVFLLGDYFCATSQRRFGNHRRNETDEAGAADKFHSQLLCRTGGCNSSAKHARERGVSLNYWPFDIRNFMQRIKSRSGRRNSRIFLFNQCEVVRLERKRVTKFKCLLRGVWLGVTGKAQAATLKFTFPRIPDHSTFDTVWYGT